MKSKSRSKGSLAPLPIELTKIESIPQPSTSRTLPIPPPEVNNYEQSEHKVSVFDQAKNTFWTSVEPYCGEISSDDNKLLDDLIDKHANVSDYQKVHPLGKHYSLRWAQEENEK